MKKLLHSFRSRTDQGGKQEDLPYMNRVDAALQRRGGIGAVFLSLRCFFDQSIDLSQSISSARRAINIHYFGGCYSSRNL